MGYDEVVQRRDLAEVALVVRHVASCERDEVVVAELKDQEDRRVAAAVRDQMGTPRLHGCTSHREPAGPPPWGSGGRGAGSPGGRRTCPARSCGSATAPAGSGRSAAPRCGSPVGRHGRRNARPRRDALPRERFPSRPLWLRRTRPSGQPTSTSSHVSTTRPTSAAPRRALASRLSLLPHGPPRARSRRVPARPKPAHRPSVRGRLEARDRRPSRRRRPRAGRTSPTECRRRP